jgi:hypothetical protein
VLLHEKLLRIPGDQCWKTYENKQRYLKTQNGFIQEVTEIQTKFEIKSKPPTVVPTAKPRRRRTSSVLPTSAAKHNKGINRSRHTKAPGFGNNEHPVPPR